MSIASLPPRATRYRSKDRLDRILRDDEPGQQGGVGRVTVCLDWRSEYLALKPQEKM